MLTTHFLGQKTLNHFYYKKLLGVLFMLKNIKKEAKRIIFSYYFKLILPSLIYMFSALRKILCKKESKQIRKQITNMVFRSENGGIHLPLLTARTMLYDGMRTAGVNNGIRHRAY